MGRRCDDIGVEPADFDTAWQLAEHAHGTQVAKDGEPYLCHVRRVVERVRELAPVDLSERCATAAALHDVVEDTAVGLDDLASMGFDDDVVAAVDSVTGREGEPYIELVRRAAADPVGRWVKLADNLDNSDETRLARLPEATAARLREKYASARRLLRAACAVGADAPSRDEPEPATPS